jgi:hypothetical protein
MKRAICTLRSAAPYSQGRKHYTAKLDGELPADYELRTWREKMHVTKEGKMFIPGAAFANSLREAAKYLSIPIPSKGKSTFTKHFDAGILVPGDLALPLKKNDVDSVTVFVPSDGKPGGGKRVSKTFPLIHDWEGKVEYLILDDIITLEAFEQVIKASGTLIGLGVYRPRNRGTYGRFTVEDIKWEEGIKF